MLKLSHKQMDFAEVSYSNQPVPVAIFTCLEALLLMNFGLLICNETVRQYNKAFIFQIRRFSCLCFIIFGLFNSSRKVLELLRSNRLALPMLDHRSIHVRMIICHINQVTAILVRRNEKKWREKVDRNQLLLHFSCKLI